jgi:pimeloyl-ACP methyl ester carboxylesterase
MGGLRTETRTGTRTESRTIESRTSTSRDGAPLSDDLRARFEPALGHDFANVRVHVGSDAEAFASDLEAHAVTAGPDIFFARGQYAPGTDAGDRVLAHELAHVAQQPEVPDESSAAWWQTTPGDAHERDAELASTLATAGAHLAPGALQARGSALTSAPIVARTPESGDAGSREELRRQSMLEMAAHVLAYENQDAKGNWTPQADPLQDPEGYLQEQQRHQFAVETMTRAGYSIGETQHGRGGFAMRTFTSADPTRDLAPIAAFRGTEDSDDVVADLDPDGIGMRQYDTNQDFIAEQLAGLRAGSQHDVTVTGHSLGGALAQMAAARHGDIVGDVSTFQAARVTSEDAAMFDAANERRIAAGQAPITSTHNRVDADIVHRAGEDMTRGNVNTYGIMSGLSGASDIMRDVAESGLFGVAGLLGARGQRAAEAHTSFPVTARALEAGIGSDIAGAEEFSSSTPGNPSFTAPTTASTDTDRADQSSLYETGRWGLGHAHRSYEESVDRASTRASGIDSFVDSMTGIDTLGDIAGGLSVLPLSAVEVPTLVPGALWGMAQDLF